MKEYYLSELLELKYGKDHKTLGNGTIPCYGSGGVIRYVNNSLYEKESILIPRKGSLNNLFFINKPFWTVDTLFWSIINEKIVLPRYLFYKLKNLNLSSFNEGSAVPSLTTKTLNKISIKIHNLQLQERIISILSSLDDKIELNKKINQNLEETAQTLFKRWFIDFEFPNEEGKPYKSSGGKLIESELGEIPEGWEVDELGNNSFLTAGGDKPNLTSKNKNEKYCIPIYSNGTDKKGLYGYTITSKINEEGITISSRGTVGYVCLRTKPYYPIVRLISIVIKNKIISNKFLYFFIKKLNIMGTGTTQQQLTIPNFKKTRILIPDISLQKRFEKLIKKSWDKIEMTEEEIEKLIELRDYLLPRLMSGEVNVSNLKISGISNSDKSN